MVGSSDVRTETIGYEHVNSSLLPPLTLIMSMCMQLLDCSKSDKTVRKNHHYLLIAHY